MTGALCVVLMMKKHLTVKILIYTGFSRLPSERCRGRWVHTWALLVDWIIVTCDLNIKLNCCKFVCVASRLDSYRNYPISRMKIFMTSYIHQNLQKKGLCRMDGKRFLCIWDCRSCEAYRRKLNRKDVCFNLEKILEDLQEHNMVKKGQDFIEQVIVWLGFFWFVQKVHHKVCMKNRVYINSALKIVLSWLVYQGFQNLSVWRIKCLEPSTATAAWHRRITVENCHIFYFYNQVFALSLDSERKILKRNWMIKDMKHDWEEMWILHEL